MGRGRGGDILASRVAGRSARGRVDGPAVDEIFDVELPVEHLRRDEVVGEVVSGEVVAEVVAFVFVASGFRRRTRRLLPRVVSSPCGPVWSFRDEFELADHSSRA